jgi:hypothetical protein
MDAHDSNSIVTVVPIHGTFARGAAWTHPDSYFMKALSQILGPGMRLRVFEWSGDNSHAARLQAGRELSEFVGPCSASHPSGPCVLIAHSHGGNVALYALRDESVRPAVSAMVCMSTPFLDCWLRDQLAPKARAFLQIVATALLLITIGGILQKYGVPDWTQPLDRAFSRLQEWGVPDPVLVILAAIGVFTPLLLGIEGVQHFLGWLDGAIHEWLAERALRRLSQLGAPLLDAPPILSVVFKRGEARGWLRSLSAIAQMPNSAKAKLGGLVSACVVWAYLIGGVAMWCHLLLKFGGGLAMVGRHLLPLKLPVGCGQRP